MRTVWDWPGKSHERRRHDARIRDGRLRRRDRDDERTVATTLVGGPNRPHASRSEAPTEEAGRYFASGAGRRVPNSAAPDPRSNERAGRFFVGCVLGGWISWVSSASVP